MIQLKEWPCGDAFAVQFFRPLNGNEDLSELEAALNKGRVREDGIVTVEVTVRA